MDWDIARQFFVEHWDVLLSGVGVAAVGWTTGFFKWMRRRLTGVSGESLLRELRKVEKESVIVAAELKSVTDERDELLRKLKAQPKTTETRSIPDVIDFYLRATALDRGDFWTWIELSRLQRAVSSFEQANKAVQFLPCCN